MPLKRLADPEEIGRVIAFLASDAASYMTGAIVDVAVEGPALDLRQGIRELVEEEPAQRPLVARVAREERALDCVPAPARGRSSAAWSSPSG